MTDREIKLRAKELCKKIVAQHPSQVCERNERIIGQLMQEFNIERERAERCFLQNNEL